MTAAQRFLNTNPDTLDADQLADLSTHVLLDEMPCEFCPTWVPRHYETDYYLIGGVEVCPECEAKFQENKRRYLAGEEPLPDV